jgi:hypothetical protein
MSCYYAYSWFSASLEIIQYFNSQFYTCVTYCNSGYCPRYINIFFALPHVFYFVELLHIICKCLPVLIPYVPDPSVLSSIPSFSLAFVIVVVLCYSACLSRYPSLFLAIHVYVRQFGGDSLSPPVFCLPRTAPLYLIKHHAMKIYGGVEVLLHHSWPWHKVEVSGHLHAPAALPPGTHRIGGWVGPRAGLDTVV